VSYLSSLSLSKTFSRLSTVVATEEDHNDRDGESRVLASIDDGDADEIPSGSLGLHGLHAPVSEARVDIIFVHGLGGDARKTWSKSGQNFWPRDWLPADPAFQHARIHTYGYDSAYMKGREDCLNIHHMGKALLGELSSSPDIVASKGPIVAVGHSMGGLVIKKMYILAKQDAAYKHLAARFSAIYFLATPHRGADSAKLLSNILKVAVHERVYVSDLSRNSGAIQAINEDFRHVSEGLELWSFYETQTMKRFSSPIVSPDSAVLGYREEKQVPMSADHRTVCKFDSPSDPNYRLLRNSLASTLSAITAQTSEAETIDSKTQMRELRKYLGVLDVLDDDFLTAKEARMGNSCQWVLGKEAYTRWEDTTSADGRVLWLRGSPGHGKSVLAAFVADKLQHSGQACSYFFFKHGDKPKTQLSTCLRSLALQAAKLNRNVRDAILRLSADEIRLVDANERTLWRSLFVDIILRHVKTPLYLVIDALDECAYTTTLFDAMLPSLNEASSSLRILVTSRDTPEISQGFKNLPPKLLSALPISAADTTPDLELIIRTKVEILSFVMSTDRPSLVEAISEKAKGSFLWANLVLKELSLCHSKKEMDQILEEIPRGMQSFYKRTLDLMEQAPRGRVLARSVLVWASCAVRPLSLNELSGALLYDIDDSFPKLGESIATLCGELVKVDRSDRVQMVHETAREFLLSEEVESDFAVDVHNAHAKMAMACLRYLVCEEMKPPRTARRRAAVATPPQRTEFSVYACAAFSQHLAGVSSSAIEELLPLLIQFLKSNILTWIELAAVSQDLDQLVQTARNFRKFLHVCSTEPSPLGPQIQTVRQWSIDLTRVAAKFPDALIASPAAIYSLVPPLCPIGSMIHRTGGNGRGLTVTKVSAKGEQWDDRLISASFDGQSTVLCHSDEFLAVGLQTGAVVLHYVTSHQQYRTIQHGEGVKLLLFKGKSSGLLVTCGFKMIKVWDLKTGTMIHELECPPRPIAMAFDGPKLLVASQKGYLRCWVFAGETLASESFTDTFWSDSPADDDRPGYLPRQNGFPTAFVISIPHRMLAVAYTGQPICLWDLEEDAYFGSCGKRLSNGELSSYRVVAMAFNPNPSTTLFAASYQDGDLVILDPFVDEQLACVRAECHTLAASPDGRLLAAGTANGVFDIYKFDTLELLCRIRSSISHVKQISFSPDSLRLADIRSTQCTVWEPITLLGGLMGDYRGGGTLSTPVVDTTSLDANSRITAMVYATGLDLIICGKYDGSLVIYDPRTAAVLKTCHTRKVTTLHLRWWQSQSAVLSVDASNRICLQRIQMKEPRKRTLEIEVVFQISLAASGWVATDILLAEEDKFLVSTKASDHLFSVEGTLISERTYDLGEGPAWIRHPSSTSHLLGLAPGGQIHVESWTDWSGTPSPSMPITGDAGSLRLKNAWEFRLPGRERPYVLLEYSDKDGLARTTRVAVYEAEGFATTNISGTTDEHETVDRPPAAEGEVTSRDPVGGRLSPTPASIPDKIAHIIGINDRGALVFLDHDYWLCSCDLKAALAANDLTSNAMYTRHCFVPYEWLAGRKDIICCMARGSIVFARTGDVVIVRGYSEFGEMAQC
jgi:WD40 repeat protein